MGSMNELAERTHGDIYIGVVGPVRVGKSTLISKLMEHLVLPLIEDDAERARMIDSIANPDKMIQTPWHETPIPFQ